MFLVAWKRGLFICEEVGLCRHGIVYVLGCVEAWLVHSRSLCDGVACSCFGLWGGMTCSYFGRGLFILGLLGYALFIWVSVGLWLVIWVYVRVWLVI